MTILENSSWYVQGRAVLPTAVVSPFSFYIDMTINNSVKKNPKHVTLNLFIKKKINRIFITIILQEKELIKKIK